MTTEKQIQANRRNALLGGVKTAEGKAAVRLNALSHGLLSREVLIKGEDGMKLAALRQQYMDELQPQGEIETLLVERIVSSAWRLRRALRLEKIGTKRGGDYRYDEWQHYLKYETTLERQIFKALHELAKLQASRAPQPESRTSYYGFQYNDQTAAADLEEVARDLKALVARHKELISSQSFPNIEIE